MLPEGVAFKSEALPSTNIMIHEHAHRPAHESFGPKYGDDNMVLTY